MSPRFSKARRQAGFSLIEMLVTLLSLAVILTIAGQLMFGMRRGLQRQQLQVEARQNVRAALDYTSMLLRGATDFNKASGNAGAVLTWVWSESRCTGGGCTGPTAVTCPGYGGCYQVSYNNITASNNAAGILADLGTDIIVVGRPEGTVVATSVSWPGYTDSNTAGWLTPSCTADTAAASQAAFAAFQTVTGAHLEGSNTVSDTLVVAGDNGWTFYKITNYQAGGAADNQNSCCIARAVCPDASATNRACLSLVGSAGGINSLNPPGAHVALLNPRLVAGMRFVSLRVRSDAAGVPWLEQKEGIFDPAVDNPGANFVPILPNVEDMQLAWIFRDGSVQNDAPGHQLTGTGQVPRSGTAGPTADDVQNVVGLRVTFSARSALGMSVENARFFRQAAEDRAASTTRDTVYRYQASANAMIRNRMTGS